MLSMIHSLLATKLVPIFFAGIGFGLLITVHEFGHFLFCKLFGIGTPVFSIGFGPSLIKRQIGSTEFRLSLIPLGGYCAVQGMGEVEVVDIKGAPQADDSASFETKAFWQKVLVILGGIAFNIMFAYLAFTAIHVGSRPKMRTELSISQVVKNSAAAAGGIQKDSILRGYNGTTFSTDAAQLQTELKTFLASIAKSPGSTLVLHAENTQGTTAEKKVTLGGKPGTTGSLGIGIELSQKPVPGVYEHDSLSSAFSKGVTMTHRWIIQTASGIANMFKRRTLEGVGGPVAMFSQTFKMAKTGWRSFVNFLAIISISLAVINLLPLGALDGGQLLFAIIEFITRRRLPLKLKEAIIIVSWLLFFALILILSYRDIMRIFGY